jgi:ABC-type dipeptide/oligopeptide/nickel transport system ATPase component
VSALLQVTDLNVTFDTGDVQVPAVRGLNYHVDPREVVAIVGESGSGKTTAAMAVMGLLPETSEVSGSVRLHGEELIGLPDNDMSRIRGKSIGMVFQDPMSALTPVYTIGDQIAEALEVHNRGISRAAARKRAVELLDLVEIAQPERRARAFPHELSGGQRQRVVIAIAIANDPDLLICDEPTTALDVTVQAQILDLLRTARDVTGAGVLIITHDLGVVSEFADRALVMYAGRAAGCPTPSGCSVRYPVWTPRRAPAWFRSPERHRRWRRCRWMSAHSSRAVRWRSTNAVPPSPISSRFRTDTVRHVSVPTTSRDAVPPKYSVSQHNRPSMPRRWRRRRPANRRWCCG